MTVLLRLAVLVLLVYCVQSAVTKTRQDQSQPDKNRPSKLHAKSQTQVKTKRTDAKSTKIQLKRNDAQKEVAEKRTSKSNSSPKTAPKHEDKRLKNAKKSSADHPKKAPSSSRNKKVESKKKVAKKKPLVVKEFPLNDIIFKGRATSKYLQGLVWRARGSWGHFRSSTYPSADRPIIPLLILIIISLNLRLY